jgi:hypothetical protein
MAAVSESVTIDRARRDRRDLEAMLPPEVTRIVRNLRDDTAALSIFGAFLGRVMAVAQQRGLTFEIEDVPPRTGLRHLDQREIALQLARREDIRGWLRGLVRRHLRQGHIQRVRPQPLLSEVCTEGAFAFRDGAMLVWGSIGLGTSTMLDAEPEGWVVWAHESLVREAHARLGDPGLAVEDVGLDDPAAIDVLVVGSDTGALARLVASQPIGSAEVRVHWVGGILDGEGELPGVAGELTLREAADAIRQKRFDAGVLVLPAPIVPSSAGQRAIYREPGRTEESRPDPGRVGLGRWTHWLRTLLALMHEGLREGARCLALVPLGDRVRRGYRADPGRADLVRQVGRESGFRIEAEAPVIELAPARRPFVGRDRPPLLSMVLRRAG